MSFFPDVRTVVNIGPLSIKWYALLILTGALISYAISARNIKKLGYDSTVTDDLFFGSLIAGIIGSRIWYVLFYDLSSYLANPLSIFMTWNGGMAIQGGLMLGALYAFVYLKRKNISFMRFADAIVPSILIAQALGRWGNFMNQEAYGQVVSESFYTMWPEFIKTQMFIMGEYRAPTFFYESILNILGYVLIVYGLKRFGENKRGDYAYAYLMWYGLIRFWVEGMRSDSLMFAGLRTAQLLSILFIIIGIAGKAGLFRKWFKEDKPAIIFDLDGTLLNTDKTIWLSAEKVLEKYRPNLKLTHEQKLGFIGPTLHQSFSLYLNEDEIEGAIELYREHNKKAHETDLEVIPYAKVVLEHLKQQGYSMGIFSSKKKEMVVYGLELSGLATYFDVVIGHDEVKKHKPDPEGIFITLKEMGKSRDNAVYIGDSHSDIEAARRAGIYSIAYLRHAERSEAILAAKPNSSISDLRDVQLILQGDHSWTQSTM